MILLEETLHHFERLGTKSQLPRQPAGDTGCTVVAMLMLMLQLRGQKRQYTGSNQHFSIVNVVHPKKSTRIICIYLSCMEQKELIVIPSKSDTFPSNNKQYPTNQYVSTKDTPSWVSASNCKSTGTQPVWNQDGGTGSGSIIPGVAVMFCHRQGLACHTC